MYFRIKFIARVMCDTKSGSTIGDTYVTCAYITPSLPLPPVGTILPSDWATSEEDSRTLKPTGTNN